MTAVTDRDLVVEQLACFAKALDARDWDLLRALMTPDVHAYGKDGRDAVLAQVRSHLGGVGPSQHLLGNHRISVEGDEAHSFTYARVHHVGAGPMEGSFFECMGEYDDHWRRAPDGWLLERRRFDMTIMVGDFAVLR